MAQFLKKTIYASLHLTKNYPKFPYFYRTFTTSRRLDNNYEGDGKTTVTILNREYKNLILINSYSTIGFRLNNGIYTMGPIAVFPRTVLQWNISSIEEMMPESFSLFCLLEPKIDILVLGTGDVRKFPSKDILKCLKSNNISVEILPTEQACATFNFLNSEGRCIAGAFIPPIHVTVYDEEITILDNVEEMDNYTVTHHEKIHQ